jgi:hypothetical protein
MSPLAPHPVDYQFGCFKIGGETEILVAQRLQNDQQTRSAACSQSDGAGNAAQLNSPGS